MAEEVIVEPPYVSRLENALKQELDGAEVRHEQLRADRYRFEVLWPAFDAMEHPERQRIVWDIVERSLDKKDFMKVSMIITIGDEDLPKE